MNACMHLRSLMERKGLLSKDQLIPEPVVRKRKLVSTLSLEDGSLLMTVHCFILTRNVALMSKLSFVFSFLIFLSSSYGLDARISIH